MSDEIVFYKSNFKVSHQFKTDGLNHSFKEWRKFNNKYLEIAAPAFGFDFLTPSSPTVFTGSEIDTADVWCGHSIPYDYAKFAKLNTDILWSISSIQDIQTRSWEIVASRDICDLFKHDQHFEDVNLPAIWSKATYNPWLHTNIGTVNLKNEFLQGQLTFQVNSDRNNFLESRFTFSNPVDYLLNENLFGTLTGIKDQLSSHDHRVFRRLGKTIDSQLDLYTSTQNNLHLFSVINVLQSFSRITEMVINVIDRVRTFFLRISKISVKRDLRQSFRNLICFLFKNMDDCSGDHDELFSAFSKQSLLINFNVNSRDSKIYHLLSG